MLIYDDVVYDGGAMAQTTGASIALVHPDSNNTVGTNWGEATTVCGKFREHQDFFPEVILMLN